LREPGARHVAHRAHDRRREDEQVAEQARVIAGLVRPREDDDHRAHQRYGASEDPESRHAAALDDRPEQAGEYGEYREDERAVHGRGHVLAEGEDEREADVGGGGGESEEASLVATGGQPLAHEQGERQREAPAQHGAQDADEQRVDLLGGDLGEDRGAAPDDHDGKRHRKRQRQGVVGLSSRGLQSSLTVSPNASAHSMAAR